MDTTLPLAGTALITFAVIAVPAVVSWIDRRRQCSLDYAHDWMRDERMPLELKIGSVYMNEREISMIEPVRLHGRVDQVYRTPDGVLVPVDTKTRNRHRTYSSDILQLSIYAVILRHQESLPVANHGYIRSVVYFDDNEKSVRYHRVPLLTTRKVMSLVYP